MSANILDGKALSQQKLATLKDKIKALPINQRTPHLAVILLEGDPASQIYVNHKARACATVNMQSSIHQLEQSTSEESLLTLIKQLNEDQNIDGILVQLPLPKHINTEIIINSIHPQKDVDGFHPINLGALAQNTPLLRPCTPQGIMDLLQHYKIPLAGKNAVVIGSSRIVGRPLAFELLNQQATITICHSKTMNLATHIKQADILCAAIGNPNIVKAEWIKRDATIIDVGINRTHDQKVIGDVDFNAAIKIAKWITPVPGGVGPMTIACLLENTWLAFNNSV